MTDPSTSIFVIALLVGLIPAAIAQSKGRTFGTWWAFGTLFFILALPLALMLKPEDAPGRRLCPMCAESISTAARVCKHCGRDVVEPAATDPPQS